MLTFKLENNKADYTYVREEVFVIEQGFVNEFDEIDSFATHITFYDQDALIGCGRFFEENNTPIIGRICVLKPYRGRGFATQFLTIIENEIKKSGGIKSSLHAQLYAKNLYEKSGYTQSSEIEYDEGVEHIWMTKIL